MRLAAPAVATLALATLALAAAAAAPSAGAQDAEALRAVPTARIPHDRGAFTQGLVFAGRRLFESTGLYGASTLRELDPGTGRVLRRRALPARLFAEGLAAVEDRLVQLTWREGTAEVWDAGTLRRMGRHRYAGEGWGLCYDGRRLVQSDGSARLTFRDPATFAVRGSVVVTVAGPPRTLLGLRPGPVRYLNELECRAGKVYANVWHADVILRIDPAGGRVEAVIDASGLPRPRDDLSAVLNGIAYDPARRAFVVTGKRWPWLYRVRFVVR
jgi:glutaminyl-peptide cyclotransferase